MLLAHGRSCQVPILHLEKGKRLFELYFPNNPVPFPSCRHPFCMFSFMICTIPTASCTPCHPHTAAPRRPCIRNRAHKLSPVPSWLSSSTLYDPYTNPPDFFAAALHIYFINDKITIPPVFYCIGRRCICQLYDILRGDTYD